MQTGNRFRCYPTQAQAHSLLQWIGCQRFIYNGKVREDRYFRAFARKSLQHAGHYAPIDQQYSHFKTELTPFLGDVPSVVLRNGSVKWKQAYSRFFSKLGGRPVIQRNHGKQSVWLTKELFEFQQITLADTGEVRWHLHIGTKKHPIGFVAFKSHRAFEPPASMHISVHAGKWFLSFCYDDGVSEPDEKDTIAWLRQFDEAELLAMTVGLDRGVTIPFAASNGNDFDFTDVLKYRLAKQDQHKKRWQRKQARRQLGSNRWKRAKQRVATHSRYAADVRTDFAHQTSHRLVADSGAKLFVVEDLKVKKMTASAKGTIDAPGKKVAQKAGLNRSILASAWGQTKTYLQYKAKRNGKLCIAVSPQYSSQECAACGDIHKDNRISQSDFVCQCCGHKDHADRNASKVIAKRGVKLLLSGAWKKKASKTCAITRTKVGVECPEPVEIILPTLVETEVSRSGGNTHALWSLNRETPETTSKEA